MVMYMCINRPEFQRLRLESLLILPIQRIPRYELLLRSLLGELPQASAERQQLEGVVSMVSSTNIHINEHIRRRNTADKAVMLEQRLIGGEGKLIAVGRVLVKEGYLYKICTDSQVRIRQCYLCSDTFVYAKRGTYNQRGSFAYRKSIELVHTSIYRAQVRATGLLVLQLAFTDGHPPITFYAETQEETGVWYHAIRNTIAAAVANRDALAQRRKTALSLTAAASTPAPAPTSAPSSGSESSILRLHAAAAADGLCEGDREAMHADSVTSPGSGAHARSGRRNSHARSGRRNSMHAARSSLCLIL